MKTKTNIKIFRTGKLNNSFVSAKISEGMISFKFKKFQKFNMAASIYSSEEFELSEEHNIAMIEYLLKQVNSIQLIVILKWIKSKS
jgi:hypothetical protein